MQKMTTRIDEGGKKGMRAKRGKKAGTRSRRSQWKRVNTLLLVTRRERSGKKNKYFERNKEGALRLCVCARVRE